MPDILPDSRLKLTKNTLMVDWPLGDGTKVRIEIEPVFCANCGVSHGYVPTENTIWAFWLCQKCYDQYGVPASLMVALDDDFWHNVQEEMLVHYGHVLNQFELERLAEEGWGPLATLVKESPIKTR